MLARYAAPGAHSAIMLICARAKSAIGIAAGIGQKAAQMTKQKEFVVVSCITGRLLSTNSDFFTDDFGRVRIFPSRDSANEMIRSYAAPAHRKDFAAQSVGTILWSLPVERLSQSLRPPKFSCEDKKEEN